MEVIEHFKYKKFLNQLPDDRPLIAHWFSTDSPLIAHSTGGVHQLLRWSEHNSVMSITTPLRDFYSTWIQTQLRCNSIMFATTPLHDFSSYLTFDLLSVNCDGVVLRPPQQSTDSSGGVGDEWVMSGRWVGNQWAISGRWVGDHRVIDLGIFYIWNVL